MCERLNIDFLDCLNNRLDNQLTCKFDILLVNSFDETEKTDFDKHYSNNEIEKIDVETIEIETIVVEIAIDNCYYINRCDERASNSTSDKLTSN